jgi:hypothetical protein
VGYGAAIFPGRKFVFQDGPEIQSHISTHLRAIYSFTEYLISNKQLNKSLWIKYLIN